MEHKDNVKKLLYLFIGLFSMTLIGQNEPLFEKGKELYKAENFQEAINNWSQIVDNGEHSADLYYNLGNAHYKLNNVGPSIYYYEKALMLEPNDSDVKNNLAFAKNATIDVIEPLPKTFFAKWYESLSGVLTYDGWALLAVLFAMLFVLLFLGYYFSFSEKRKRLLFTSSIASVILLLGSLAIAFMTFNDCEADKPAIIFAESTEIRSEPNMGSETAFTLHEGTKVQVIADDGDWLRIQLIDGKDGWIPSEDLKLL